MKIRKFIYVGLILLYAGAGVSVFTGQAYVETGAASRIIRTNLLLIAAVSAVIGFLVIYFFPKVFPKGYAVQRPAGKMVIYILFFILSFGCTVAFFQFINSSMGDRKKITIEGRIFRKWMEKGNKGSRSYFVQISDRHKDTVYKFKIKKYVYNQLGYSGSSISKEFTIGSLGVMYRRNY